MPNDMPVELQWMFKFYERLHRKGPGGTASTHKAIGMLGDLPEGLRVVDLGCGSGTSSLVLAETLNCDLTAIDIHQPFLDDLARRAAHHEIGDRITTVCADMADPPLVDASFDLVWAEGAIYLVGFEEGLRRWRRLLKPGGHIAVTHITWLTDDPPAETVEFWRNAYPTMTTIEENLATLRATGFAPVGHFVLPPEDWENFYAPLREQLAKFREEYADEPGAMALVEEHERELDVWKNSQGSYSYVFYVAKAV